jgi:hypothetical protein
MYVFSVIYLQPLNPKSTASGASLAFEASQESLESGASGPSDGENGRLKIDVAENVRSLLHFRREPSYNFFVMKSIYRLNNKKKGKKKNTVVVGTIHRGGTNENWKTSLELSGRAHGFPSTRYSGGGLSLDHPPSMNSVLWIGSTKLAKDRTSQKPRSIELSTPCMPVRTCHIIGVEGRSIDTCGCGAR